ncbi:MAG: pantoate--beta-alanine ligase [Calditrichaeota bacterium]|nr:pantoate--beta-alanine ligase [Calditrichota bacterium]
MKTVTDIENMQSYAEKTRREGKVIALVPTMGFLHEGHLSLIRMADKAADLVVTSIYVNPTQFGPSEDVDQYPRDIDHDTTLAQQAGTDVLFVPTDKAMYPQGYQTFVTAEKLTRSLCGAFRPTHFRGVTTIVTKLFNIVKPHIAIFGQKDAQQAIVIRQMTRDLNFDVEIKVAPIIRHEDGLAMSSRNKYLTPQQRSEAPVLYQSLCEAQKMIEGGERNPNVVKKYTQKMIDTIASSKIDYIEIVDAVTLEAVREIKGNILIALAVYIGKARLIDNILIKV